MKLQKHMAGRAATTFVTLLVIAIVGVAVFFAVDSMLGGDSDKDQAKAEATDTLTADDARRIGREEGAKVARDIAYDVALDVAQNSGAAALYGDSYAAADSSDDSFGDDYSSTDYGSYDSSAGDGAYSGGSSTSSTSDSGSADSDGSGDYGSGAYGSDDYSSDAYRSDDYGSDDGGSSDTASAAGSDSSSGDSDNYASDDYGSDDYGSDDYGSDDYGSDDYGSDDYASDDYASDDYGSNDFGSNGDSASDTALESANSSSAADAPSRRSDPNEPEPPIRGKAPPPAVALKPWWPAAKDQAGGALKVLYAGNFKGDSANGIGVLFSSAVKADQAIGDFIKVLDDSGKAVTPDWTLGNNPALVRSGDLPRGRYLVQLKPGLQSAQGRKQSLSIEGPVFVE